MGKPLLLLLHGIGTHSRTWADHAIARLDEIGATFPEIAAGGPLTSQVTIKALNYDSVFDAQLARWRAAGEAIDGFKGESAVKVPNLVDFLNNTFVPPDEENFVWNSVMDAVTYRGVTITRGEIRTHVMKEIVSAINAHLDREQEAEISILGHSLGTIVVHDTLHLLATGEGGDAFKSEFFRFANVFLLANASKLGPKKFIDIKSDDSCTRPISAPAPTGGAAPYCGALYNFNNHWDPIGSWARFSAQGWGNGFHDVEIRHIHQLNVHGINHYIEHPRVHIPLLRALLGTFVIPDRLKDQRITDFPDLKPSACGTAVATLMNHLDQIRDETSGGDFDDIAKGMLRLYRAVREAKSSCQAMFNDADGVL